MRDLQSDKDKRGKIINKVGVRKINCLINHGTYREWAEVSAYITLPDFHRGAHMSRFVEVFEAPLAHIKLNQMTALLSYYLDSLCSVHEVEEAFVKFRLHYPYTQVAPESNRVSTRKIPLELEGEKKGNTYTFYFKVILYVTSLCPCSKLLSDHGAHNQRTMIEARCRLQEDIDFSEFLDCMNLGSAPIIELLKRPDEKAVTEEAYENPKFCEDIARDVAKAIEKFVGVENYSIVVESEESIHDHTALAIIDHFKFE